MDEFEHSIEDQLRDLAQLVVEVVARAQQRPLEVVGERQRSELSDDTEPGGSADQHRHYGANSGP